MTAIAFRPVVIDGSTLSRNSSAATISGKHIVSDHRPWWSETQWFSFPISSLSRRELHHLCEHINRVILTLGSQTLTAVQDSRPGNGIVVGSPTLIAGGPAVTIDGKMVSAKLLSVILDAVSTVTFTEPTSATSMAGGISGTLISVLGQWDSPSGTTAAGNSIGAHDQNIEQFSSAAPGRRVTRK